MKHSPRTNKCANCGQSMSKGAWHKFCNIKCRKAFNNRRMSRGAIIYDLAMVWRKERKKEGLANLCHQIGIFIQDDNDNNRTSYNEYPNGITWNIPPSAIEIIPGKLYRVIAGEQL